MQIAQKILQKRHLIVRYTFDPPLLNVRVTTQPRKTVFYNLIIHENETESSEYQKRNDFISDSFNYFKLILSNHRASFNVKLPSSSSLSIYPCIGKLVGLQELCVVCSVPESHSSVFSGRSVTIIKM